MMNKEIEKTIRKYLKLGEVFTPIVLCELLISKVPKEGMKLVVHNLELIYMMMFTGHDMNTVWFASDSSEKVIFAGLTGCHTVEVYADIYDLEIKLKELNMKFDTTIMNPPYTKGVWSKFVKIAMEYVKDDGRIIVIHPNTWRESSDYDKLADILKTGISELHIMDYEAFKEVNLNLQKLKKVTIKTDWYIWHKNYIGKQKVYYSNGTFETVNLKTTKKILRISTNSIPARILDKITKEGHDNGMIIDQGYSMIKHDPNGIYKQCGGTGKRGQGTSWTDEKYTLTKDPTEHQFENKVVMSYTGEPRAKYFSAKDAVGIGRANYWLTDNKSIPILLNSKMFWKIVGEEISFWHNGLPALLPAWILKSLYFEGLNVSNKLELYKHYNLTDEEIKWCES